MVDLRQRRGDHTHKEEDHPNPPQANSPKDSQKQSNSSVAMNNTAGRPGANAAQSGWLFFAITSGACAAFNGVFAKLTTTELTTTLSNSIANFLGMSAHEQIVEYVVRGIFFVLNLTFNGIMWSLFTTALARGKSATQVSIMNTSTNFLVTAFTGMLIFSEALPPLWWAGATLLVAGSVVAGRKDESDASNSPSGEGYTAVPGQELQDDLGNKDDEDEDVANLGELRS